MSRSQTPPDYVGRVDEFWSLVVTIGNRADNRRDTTSEQRRSMTAPSQYFQSVWWIIVVPFEMRSSVAVFSFRIRSRLRRQAALAASRWFGLSHHTRKSFH
jgi:hypothetical protein